MKLTMIAAAAAAAAALAFASLPVLAEEAGEGSAPQCLGCHGPYEKVRELTKDWKDEFGDPVQPHQYMDAKAAKPHAARKIAPDCKMCHGTHPIPPTKGMTMKKPTLNSCYGCHHMENFQKCSSSGCHEKDPPRK